MEETNIKLKKLLFIRMNNATNLLKGSGANIDEFVKRSNNLKIVQRLLPKYKYKFGDI